MTTSKKEIKDIFVIMPFRQTPSRNKSQLTAFFNDYLKARIEKGRFKFKYNVYRSDDTFNITEKIIKDIFSADIVICDLSGKESNPNVMYELGLRLGLSDNPVILIRENNPDNKTIFDISGFYAFSYDPLNYEQLINHVKDKLKKLENEEEKYHSPVLNILKQDIPLISEMSNRRAREQLVFMLKSVEQVKRLFVYSLDDYLEEKEIKFDTGENFEDIIAKIEEGKDEFSKIDFSEFYWQFSSQPIIDSYLSAQYLNNILDATIVSTFTLYLIRYHAHFLGSNVMYNKWNSLNIWKYLGETQILLLMINIVYYSLLDDCDETKLEKYRKDLKELVETSQLRK